MDRGSRRRTFRAGLLATISVAIAGIGEALLHYNPNGYAGAADFAFLSEISERRIVTGHFLAVLFVPGYLLGYWHIAQGLRPASDRLRRVVWVLGCYTFVIGAVWIGSRAMLAKVVQFQPLSDDPSVAATLVADYQLLMEPLVWLVRLGVLAISLLFTFLVLRAETSYPKWMAWTSPAWVLIAVFASLWILPVIGRLLVASAMNVSHLVFFGASTIALRHLGREEP